MDVKTPEFVYVRQSRHDRNFRQQKRQNSYTLDETEASTRQYDNAIQLVTSNATEILTQDSSYTSDATKLSTRLDETEAQRVNSTDAVERGRRNVIKFVYERRDRILTVYDRHSSYKKSTEKTDASEGIEAIEILHD